MTTITASTTVGIDLNPAFYTSPVVIGAGVTVSNPGYPYAVYRHAGATTFFVVQNDGAITSTYITSTSGSGVYLAPGGSVANEANAFIYGKHAVIISGGAGTVMNDGTIAGMGTGGIGVDLASGGSVTNASYGAIFGARFAIDVSGGAGTVVNEGSVFGLKYVVYLTSGGSVTNAASASISNVNGFGAIYVSGGPGTVVNDGSIASTGSGGVAVVWLFSGGSVTNAASASISGGNGPGAIYVSGGPGTVVNEGSIASTGFGVRIQLAGTLVNDGSIAAGPNGSGANIGSGSLTNAASASIRGRSGVEMGAGTVVNDGSIAGDMGTRGIGANLDSGSLSNGASASITGYYAGVGIRGAGTVVNDGSIAGTGLQPGIGVYLGSGLLTNGASASIIGAVGVDIRGAGTVVNDGSIAGTRGLGIGVRLASGSSVTNASSASITGRYWGVSGGAGTILNEGRIADPGGIGVYLASGGSVTNAASASITGGIGVEQTGGTLTNGGSIIGTGTIIGTPGTAVAFGAGTGSNLLVLDAGFGFSGLVSGGTSSSNSIELASGSSTGTVTGLGTEFIHFGSIAFDPGAQWFASGVQRGLAGPITGFAAGDTIELTGDTAVGSSFVTGVLTLDLAGGGLATLDLPGPFTLASFEVTNVAAGADVTVIPCFCAGTHIATPRGETAVVDLVIGEHVITRSGEAKPIKWLGRRSVDCRPYPRPQDVWPVRITADAFGPAQPRRDLMLSPDHAVFVDGVLIPVRYLVNGVTIRQQEVNEVTYWHVELARHDVILAEGLPCESYLDTGNRAAFVNGRAETLHGEDDLLTVASTSSAPAMARHIAS